uniref:hypothetical protein n=1 Tax=Sphingomonas bacterium TaxID=1895847 RepID=UPI0015770525
VRIDRATGQPVTGGAWPTADPKSEIIWEAFKPESEPRRIARRAAEPGTAAPVAAPAHRAEKPADGDFVQRQGGIY